MLKLSKKKLLETVIQFLHHWVILKYLEIITFHHTLTGVNLITEDKKIMSQRVMVLTILISLMKRIILIMV